MPALYYPRSDLEDQTDWSIDYTVLYEMYCAAVICTVLILSINQISSNTATSKFIVLVLGNSATTPLNLLFSSKGAVALLKVTPTKYQCKTDRNDGNSSQCYNRNIFYFNLQTSHEAFCIFKVGICFACLESLLPFSIHN